MGAKVTPLETLTFSATLYAIEHPERADIIVPAVIQAVPQLSRRACRSIYRSFQARRNDYVGQGYVWPHGVCWAQLELALKERYDSG